VEREFQFRKLNWKDLVNPYNMYIKNLYEEQVFRSVTTKSDASESHRENAKIVKKMRERK
jgi:hypothetical protein